MRRYRKRKDHIYKGQYDHEKYGLGIAGSFKSDDGDILEIGIGDDECDHPHFHITNKRTNESCCISMIEPKYFIHKKETLLLSESEKERLYEYLKSTKYDSTVWDVVELLWGYDRKGYDTSKPMPDYRKLNGLVNIHNGAKKEYYQRYL